MRAWVLLLGVGWGAMAVPAWGASEGANLYKKHCSVCHGDRGNGQSRVQGAVNPPPRDFTAPLAREELTRERMITSVTYGRPGTAMMAFDKRLNTPQIAAVVDFIRQEFMRVRADQGRGQQLYKRHCAACHGENGNTSNWAKAGLNPPPRDFTDPAAREELSNERMIASVTHGRPGTAMMPFQSRLSAADIQSVVHYVRANFMTPPTGMPATHPKIEAPRSPDAPKIDMAAALPEGLRGDYARGEAFFQANCFVCHGREGRGDGPRARFNIPRPRDFTSADTRAQFNRPHLFASIAKGKPGTVMPAWGTVLDRQQIADVSEYVFRTFVKPDKKKAP